MSHHFLGNIQFFFFSLCLISPCAVTLPPSSISWWTEERPKKAKETARRCEEDCDQESWDGSTGSVQRSVASGTQNSTRWHSMTLSSWLGGLDPSREGSFVSTDIIQLVCDKNTRHDQDTIFGFAVVVVVVVLQCATFRLDRSITPPSNNSNSIYNLADQIKKNKSRKKERKHSTNFAKRWRKCTDSIFQFKRKRIGERKWFQNRFSTMACWNRKSLSRTI